MRRFIESPASYLFQFRCSPSLWLLKDRHHEERQLVCLAEWCLRFGLCHCQRLRKDSSNSLALAQRHVNDQKVTAADLGPLQVRVLLVTAMVSSATGLVLELLLVAQDYLMGDATLATGVVVGTFLAAMGLGAWFTEFIAVKGQPLNRCSSTDAGGNHPLPVVPARASQLVPALCYRRADESPLFCSP